MGEERPQLGYIWCFIAVTIQYVQGQTTFSWSRVNEGMRVNEYVLQNIPLQNYIQSDNVSSYPLLVGASIAEFESLPNNLFTGIDRSDLLNSAASFLHPAQIAALSRKTDWRITSNARPLVRPFLTLEQLTTDLDGSEEIFDDDEMPWASILKIAVLTNNYPEVSAESKFLAVSWPREIEEITKDWGIQHIDVVSKSLTLAQIRVLVRQLENMSEASKADARTSVNVPQMLLSGLKAGSMLDMGKQHLELALESSRFLPSQKFATFQAIQEANEGNFEALVEVVATNPQLFNFMGIDDIEKETKTILEAVTKQLKSTTMEGYSKMLPRHLTSALLMDLRTNIELSRDESLYLPIMAVTCQNIEPLNDRELLATLKLHRPHIENGPMAVNFPLSKRRCFSQKLETVLQDAKDGLDVTTFSGIGGHVLSALSIETIRQMGARVGLVHQVEILFAIGQVPQIELAAIVPLSKLEELADLAEETLADQRYPAKLYRMGSLIHFSRTELSLSRPADIKALIRRRFFADFQRTLCIPKMERTWWARALVRAYGPISRWNSEDLYQIGDLLVTLSSNQLSLISVSELKNAVPYLLESSKYMSNFDSIPAFANSTIVYQVCEKWLGPGEGQAFMAQLTSLHRLYLQASQLRVNEALEKPSRKKRSLESLAGFRFLFNSRVKRQSEAQSLFSTIVERTQIIVAAFSERELFTGTQEEDIRQLIRDNQLNTQRLIFRELALTGDLTYTQTIEKLQNQLQEETISEERYGDITSEITRLLYDTARKIGAVLDLTPDNLRLTREEFCSFFQNLEFCQRPPPTLSTTQEPTTIPEPTTTTAPVVDRSDNFDFSSDYEDGVSPIEFEDLDGGSVVSARERTLFLPKEFSCHGVKAARDSAIALSPEDLDSWTAQELENCVEVLGNIRWPLSTKISVWNLMRKKNLDMFTSDKMKPDQMISLNNLIEAVALVSPQMMDLDMKHVDALSVLGEFRFPLEVLALLAQQITTDSNGTSLPMKTGDPKSSSLFNALIIASMNHLVCGQDPEEVQKYMDYENTAQLVLPVLARMKSCPSEKVLEVLAKEAKDQYGLPHTWTSETVQYLGIVVAGLPPSEFRSIAEEARGAISPEVFEHLKYDHFKEVLAENLDQYAEESLGRLDTIQMRSEDGQIIPQEHIEMMKSIDRNGHIGLMKTMVMLEELGDIMPEPKIGASQTIEGAEAEGSGIQSHRPNWSTLIMTSLLALTVSAFTS
ncbi:hypothetical protein TCAL_01375 [Tigriopus californicus]|uniref:Uncharacterized protein n=1 Tax=Tigriopus californicus TaxID=6832 RepID=A0A553NUS1_TIGCA|nr:uncharacterized protein LOC131886533 [Tigriopus californicus]TRY69173.1 hypothetical protein TCAL_01375 [Tigriopus californicus]|eukprot:TCALIF_01375-PA protein Name:"Similar to Otoa Otoancorin (Mus musculus)" AED:0.14 eAED:0.14 QI:215/1/1/1/1/1/8/152/1234